MQINLTKPVFFTAYILCALVLPFKIQAMELKLTPEQVQQDILAIEEMIKVTHPNISFSTDEIKLERSINLIKRHLRKDMDSDETWRTLSTINPIFADGHLFVGFSDWRAESKAHLSNGGSFFPYEVAISGSGDVYVKSELGGKSTKYSGAKLKSINKTSTKKITRELLSRMHGETKAFRIELLSRRFWFFYWKMYGEKENYHLEFYNDNFHPKLILGSNVIPSIISDEENFSRQFHFEVLPDNVGLLTINTFSWENKEQFYEFAENTFSEMHTLGVKNLVIDIRANGGGDDDMWMHGLLRYIADKPYRWASSYEKKILEAYRDKGETNGDIIKGEIDKWIQPELAHPLHYGGKTYLLIGSSTYSSAILFSNVVQDFNFGTVVGTGGTVRANQSGGVQKKVLPNSGLAIWTPRFILVRPSAATKPVLVEPDLMIQEDPLNQSAAIRLLLRQIK